MKKKLLNRKLLFLTGFLFSLMICSGFSVFAQNKTIRGVVVDEKKVPVDGATVTIKGNTSGSTITNERGEFSLNIPSQGKHTLIISFVGMETQEVNAAETGIINVVMKSSSVVLKDVVVVGYGVQKKESVVGAIAQTTSKVLERTGGVSNIGAALTGNLPGIITLQSSGAPGQEDPTIYIRGQGTWNSSSPLILVDGIERSMTGLDVNSVASISVLKDASATAVFGVKGANGVILITTKRGSEGKAHISITSNTTVKIPSTLRKKYDSFDALRIRNMAIENELGLNSSSWSSETPYAELYKYRYPSSLDEAERYPNVNWQKEEFKPYAMSYNENISVSGGTSFVKYYTAMDFQNEGDIMRVLDNGKGYTPGYSYNRLNIRSNLDFTLTKTTKLSVNLSGIYALTQSTNVGSGWFESTLWLAAYSMAPDVFPVKYSDGYWGYYSRDNVTAINSLASYANGGVNKSKNTQINTDFSLTQDLGMFVKGLSLRGTLALDNSFNSYGGISDGGGYYQKWISPTGEVHYPQVLGSNFYDYIVGRWSLNADAMSDGSTYRSNFYQVQLNYARRFNKHEVTAMGLFSRHENAYGSVFPSYREDWVGRVTYNYAGKYFAEFNGGYNGSEKFSTDYRFHFFPSGAIGWMLSEESFLKNTRWIDRIKLRGSLGLVGSDNAGQRWEYMTQWGTGGNSLLGAYWWNGSPYNWYNESVIGNPDLHWETARKTNVGIDYGFFKGLVDGSFDYFHDYRYDIVIGGGSRAIPAYFGGTAPDANLGKVKVDGFELELKLNKSLSNGMHFWGDFNMTSAKDKIIDEDDAQLLPAYQKLAQHRIGQTYSQVTNGFYNNWDQVYGSTQLNANDQFKLPGNYNIIDFNGDGVIDDKDNIPYSYPSRPQRTYSYTVGFDYKHFSCFLQFYAVNDVTQSIYLSNFPKQTDAVFDQGSYWTKTNQNSQSFVPRWMSTWTSYGNYYLVDGSYVRLKTAEVAYTIDSNKIKKVGINSLKIYVNGNDLFLWSHMPDDREAGGGGVYPLVKRINFGVNIVL